jgi:hypothetical protein
MPTLPKKKVGLIACGGEELAEGTLSRVAVRLVLEKLRPADTVTLCLPLFLAGEKEERAFARFYPTVSVDGCGKECARRATGAYSAPVAGTVRVDTLLAELGITVRPGWRRSLDEEGWAAAGRLAVAIAAQVDGLLGSRRPEESASIAAQAEVVVVADAPCACATQIPVSRIEVAGREMELIAVMAIFDDSYRAGAQPGDGSGRSLLEAVRVYNPIPDELLPAVEQALEREYAAFFLRRKQA